MYECLGTSTSLSKSRSRALSASIFLVKEKYCAFFQTACTVKITERYLVEVYLRVTKIALKYKTL